MPIRVALYGPEHTAAVRAFNSRLTVGEVDSGYRLPEQPGPNLPPPVSKNTWLMLDETDEVRGSWMLQEQMFSIAGQAACAANVQLPLSEGLIDRKYSGVSMVMLKHLQKHNPLLFAVGMGSADQPWPRLIQAMGWKLRPVPFFFQVLRGGAFFRNIRALRTTTVKKLALDFAGLTGVGHLGIRALHAFKSRRSGQPRLQAEPVTGWGSWADEIWRAVEPQCAAIGYRDGATLPGLYPPGGRHLSYRLTERGKSVGWTVLLSTPMKDHKQFGDMRVGTILDSMALPGYETRATAAATALLAGTGAHIALANHTHEVWQAALRDNGYLEGPSNFLLGTSKELTTRIGDGENRIWFTRGDGDGRLNL